MKNKLLTYALAATLITLLFLPQFASAQNSRIWGTYYGGSVQDLSRGTATDKAGNVYLVEEAQDTGLASPGAFQDTLLGSGTQVWNALLVKFAPNGTRLWATYYGTNSTFGESVATDSAGNVYMAGVTTDTIGIASGGFLDTLAAGSEGAAFLVKFDANGNRLWATYYGGPIYTYGNSVATDAAGNVYLAGGTADTIGIASGGFLNTIPWNVTNGNYSLESAYLVKFDANGNRLWGTYYYGDTNFIYGFGTGGSTDGKGVATDISGNVYLSGNTSDPTNIASGGFQDTLLGRSAYLVKFDANGNRLWGTYYGDGATIINNDNGRQSIATDLSGNVYMAGETSDTTGVASGGFQNTYGGGYFNAFLVKFATNGNRLWATYYGGGGAAGETRGCGVATDCGNNVFMVGTTNSADSIASGGFQDICSQCGAQQYGFPFLVKFDANGNRQCATYYDNNLQVVKSLSASVAVDTAGHVYLGSNTEGFAGIASGGFQNTYPGGDDGYLVQFTSFNFTSCLSLFPVANFQSSDSTFCTPNCINYTDLSTNATSWQWSFPGGIPSSSTIQNPQGICYDSAGTFNVMLIASLGTASDTLMFTNFIKVLASPPTPAITQHHDTLYCSTDPSYTSYQWYNGSSIIPGATDTFLIITQGGNYNMAVNNEFGCQISVGISIILGIQNYSSDNHIILSPNPARNSLTICLTKNIQDGILNIYNVMGEKVFSHTFNGNTYFLSFGGGQGESSFSSGIYFVQIANESERWVGRFVKE